MEPFSHSKNRIPVLQPLLSPQPVCFLAQRADGRANKRCSRQQQKSFSGAFSSCFFVLLHLRGCIIESLVLCRKRQLATALLGLLGKEVRVLLGTCVRKTRHVTHAS